ncbi:MAG: hypothetical protein HZA04_10235, partial [Nitrospinae bacterium]|nr:hypothetical protein [Nitrospinota bacterium]
MSKSYFAQPAKYFMAEPVKIGGQLAVRYLNLDGTERIRVGGMSAFRNNNPGNAGFTPYIKSLGAIGEDTEGRAIFPDCEIGDKAMQTLLRHGMYRNMSIRETLQNYAPPKGNPTEQYIKYVTESSGLSETSNINSMTDEEFKRFTDSMKQFEDSSPEGGFDLITFVPGDQKEWHRQDFIKISAGSSSKDFGNYGPNI